MRTRLAAVAVLVCAACAACGSADHAKVTARIVGGQPRERALARELLQKMFPSPVSVVRFMGDGHVDVAGHRTAVGDSWQEYVFGYSYAVLAREQRIPIGSVSFDLGYGTLGNALANAPTTSLSNNDLRAFEKNLRAKAEADHASIWFRELRPGPVALEATVTAKRPGPFLEHDAASFLFHPPKNLFGFLFRVAYPSGKIAFSRGDSPGGTTSSWDPQLFGCIGSLVTISGPARHGPPPACPA